MQKTYRKWLLAAMVLALMEVPRVSRANIILEFMPPVQAVLVGGHPDLKLIARSDSAVDQLMSAADVLFVLDPNYVSLTPPPDQTGATPSLFSVFPAADPWGNINSGAFDDANHQYWYYSVGAFPGTPIHATPTGTVLTTFHLDALAPTLSPPLFTTVSILLHAGNGGKTTVYDGTTPNLDVTGSLGHADITILPEPGAAALLLIGSVAAGWRRRANRS